VMTDIVDRIVRRKFHEVMRLDGHDVWE